VSALVRRWLSMLLTDDRSAPQGMSLSLEGYLKNEDSLVDRLQKGSNDTLNRLSKLQDQVDRLSGMVANGQSANSAGQHHV